MNCRGWSWVGFGCLLAAVGGCSSPPPREEAPSINAADAGKAAISEYDANHDNVISGDELNKCPDLKWALKRFDTHGDGKITADNIAARIAKWQDSTAKMALFVVLLKLDGKPLDGATVTAEPEKFLGPAILPATGTSDRHGSVTLKIEGKAGANFGLYKLRVSKMVDGKETIPLRYNKETTLGLEFAPDVPEYSNFGYNFELSSK